MNYGYAGKILRVNLTTCGITIEEPDENFYRTYFGGWGFIAYWLLKELGPGVDPLGPDNKLIFALGPVTGAPIGGNGRSAVGAKSPLTGAFGEADVGGFMGAELKRAGFDAIIVEGKAPSPVYLWVHDGEAEIQDASHLWGLETRESQARIREELGDERIRTAQIGPGGERLVRYACVINDLKHSAGRTGMGAVMGSKNLKAIAVRGTLGYKAANLEPIRTISRWLADNLMEEVGSLHTNGTDDGLITLSIDGGLPTRNFQEGAFEGAEKITGATMTKTILTGRGQCFGCPVWCKREVTVDERGYRADPEYGGPEYETMAALGSCCGIDDLAAIAHANHLCSAYSLDTISTGVAIAFAMECYERGLITKEDTGGLELSFGNAEAMVKCVDMIGKREGFGDFLAEGVYRMSQEIGKGSEEFAMHVKGQEVPMHEPRIKFGLGIGYATSPTGADHVHNIHDTAYDEETGHMRALGILEPLPYNDLSPAKVRLTKYHIDWSVFHNCVGVCLFLPYDLHQMRDIVNGCTGWDTSIWELMKVGERALNMATAFNIREGFTVADNVHLSRWATPFASGPKEGVAVTDQAMAEALRLYYLMRGWDEETAIPTAAKLHELGIGWVADEMRKYGKF